MVCELPSSQDKAVLPAVPRAAQCSSVGCLQFDRKWARGAHWARLRSDLTGPHIRSAVVPSGCGAVLKLRAALICSAVCTVEAVLHLLGNHRDVPHLSKVGISFPGVVICGFVQLSLNDPNWWLPTFLTLRTPCNFPGEVQAPCSERNPPDSWFCFPEVHRLFGRHRRKGEDDSVKDLGVRR